MYEINARIKELRKVLNLNQTEFGDKIGLAPSSLSDIENNKCDVNKRNIVAICSKFQVSEVWLLEGHGHIFVEEDKKFNEFFEIYKQLNLPLQDFLLKVVKDLLDTQSKL